MRKIFLPLAVLMAIVLVIWLIGCAEEEEGCQEVAVKSLLTPYDGGVIAGHIIDADCITDPYSGAIEKVIVTFKGGAPDKDSVKINGRSATCKGTTCSVKDLVIKDLFLTLGQTVDMEIVNIKIEWTYCDGTKSGEHIIPAKVMRYDQWYPLIVETFPDDGAIDIEPLELQKEDVGIKIVFSEPITAKTGDIYIQIGEGEETERIQWDVLWSEDNTLTLKYKEGVEIPYDTKITVVIEQALDLAGNCSKLEFSFTTKAKE